MAQRLTFLLALVLIVSAPAAADTIFEQKQAVDDQIEQLRSQLDETRRREQVLLEEIAGVSAEILDLEQQVGDVAQRLAPLERELRLRELKLNRLNALYQLQSDRLRFLRAQLRVATARLALRLNAVYRADDPSELDFVFQARSFSDLLDGLDLARDIADQDKRIVDKITAAEHEVNGARTKTASARATVERQAEIVAVRVRQVKELRETLLVNQNELENARTQKRARLEDLSEEERAHVQEIDALQASSGELAAKIRAAQGVGPAVGGPTAGGLIWPVQASITSPFGWRWGRMHEGIDLGAGEGTPIAAAAAGTVIHAGWLGGYGNLVVLDHGGGLATAYAHQSRIAVSAGQSVGQGEVIGYVGNTGHSFGAHLHFEVRLNGAAVDPLGYL